MAPPPELVLPTIAAVEAAIGLAAADWRDRCHEVACKILRRRLVYGEERYGHYYGPVAPAHRRHGLPFQRHGWIEAPDGRVIDPTRWVFEAVEPYLYHGPGDDYDPGGQRLAAGRIQPYPAGPHDAATESPRLTEAQREARRRVFQLDLAGPARAHLIALAGGQDGDYSFEQVFWLANLPLSWWGEHAAAAYESLTRAGQRAMIPIDHLRLATGRPLASHRPGNLS
jgi:hypothetical protein